MGIWASGLALRWLGEPTKMAAGDRTLRSDRRAPQVSEGLLLDCAVSRDPEGERYRSCTRAAGNSEILLRIVAS